MMRPRGRDHARHVHTALDAHQKYFKQLKHVVIEAMYREKRAFFDQFIDDRVPNRHDLDLFSHFSEPDAVKDSFFNVLGISEVIISELTYYEYTRYGLDT